MIRIAGADWLVLGERDGKSLLLAKDITKKQPYNADRFCAKWEESTLCERLGDGQFLLSAEEAVRCFADNAARIACFQGSPRAWWLRDIGIKNHAACRRANAHPPCTAPART